MWRTMELIIWQRISRLEPGQRALVQKLTATSQARRMGIRPPSWVMGVYLIVLGVLTLFGAWLAGSSLFVHNQFSWAGLKLFLMILFGLLGLFFLVTGIRVESKRIRRDRFFLLLEKDLLLERSLSRVTLIPRDRLVYAYLRRETRVSGNDIHFDALVYSGEHNKHIAYDLHDHYHKDPGAEHEAADIVVSTIRRTYRIPEPPERWRSQSRK